MVKKDFVEEVPQRKRLDDNGHEIPDPTPLSLPLGFKKPEILAETVARLVRSEISRQAQLQGFETFEEAEDFDVGDDFEPGAPYETYFDPVLNRDISPHEFHNNPERYKKEYLDRLNAEFEQKDKKAIADTPVPWWRRRRKAQSDATVKGGEGGSPPSDASPKAAP